MNFLDRPRPINDTKPPGFALCDLHIRGANASVKLGRFVVHSIAFCMLLITLRHPLDGFFDGNIEKKS